MIELPERAEQASQSATNRANLPSGTAGTDLLERAAEAARDFGPLPPRIDAAIGQLGLIAVRIMSRPPSDSAQDLIILAGLLRE